MAPHAHGPRRGSRAASAQFHPPAASTFGGGSIVMGMLASGAPASIPIVDAIMPHELAHTAADVIAPQTRGVMSGKFKSGTNDTPLSGE
jgi:hypothetical protein